MDARILLVEDDPSIREVTAIGLGAAGFEITTAVDGVDALERFRAEPYDLILLDVMLPRLDGYEVARQVRRTSTVPIVMLTARADTMDVVVGLEAGADDYVRKPFDLPELIARIRAALLVPVVPAAPVLGRAAYVCVDARLHQQALDDARDQARFDLSVLAPTRLDNPPTEERIAALANDFQFRDLPTIIIPTGG